ITVLNRLWTEGPKDLFRPPPKYRKSWISAAVMCSTKRPQGEITMVAIRRVSSTVAALALFLIVPSAASAHLLSVSTGPSKCVSPLNGEYTATVTVTETYFSGTVEYIPVGQNVHELSSSTDRGNTGLNQNYFTQGAVGTQTGPVNL